MSTAAAGPRKGREVDLPDLRQKIDLLLEAPPGGRPRFFKHSAVAAAMGLDPTDLSRALGSQRLSTARVAPFLRLFGLEPGDWLLPQTAAEKAWLELAQEPVEAFRARLRLAGGPALGPPAGSLWEAFIDRLRQARVSAPAAAHCFSIVARDRQDWLQPPAATTGARMGPPGDPWRAGAQAGGLPVLRAGQFAKVFLDTQAALPRRNVAGDGAWVFLFQDVVVDRRRLIAPLVPFPGGSVLAMPDERVGGGGAEPLLQVPLPRGAEQFLEIYAEWGRLRSLVAVVSSRPLDEEILAQSRQQRQIGLERLDLLAARLADTRRWPAGSYAVWELQYKVEPAGAPTG